MSAVNPNKLDFISHDPSISIKLVIRITLSPRVLPLFPLLTMKSVIFHSSSYLLMDGVSYQTCSHPRLGFQNQSSSLHLNLVCVHPVTDQGPDLTGGLHAVHQLLPITCNVQHRSLHLIEPPCCPNKSHAVDEQRKHAELYLLVGESQPQESAPSLSVSSSPWVCVGMTLASRQSFPLSDPHPLHCRPRVSPSRPAPDGKAYELKL